MFTSGISAATAENLGGYWWELKDHRGKFIVKGDITQESVKRKVLEYLDAKEYNKLLFSSECKDGAHCGQAYWLYDARGIEVAKVCQKCEPIVKKKYRPEIFTGYTQADVDEPIEAEDY